MLAKHVFTHKHGRPHQLEHTHRVRSTKTGQQVIKLGRRTAALQVDQQQAAVPLEEVAVDLPPRPLAGAGPDK